MMWLTWRQARTQTLGTALALALFAAVLAVTGPAIAHRYDASGMATCRAQDVCARLSDTFLNQQPKINIIVYAGGIVLLYLVPALLGVFWGAPLVSREIEARTLPLGWNQSVTRPRWMITKMGVVGLFAMATAGLLSLALTWWSGPLDHAAARNSTLGLSRLGPVLFGSRGIAPIGYAAFAFVLGVTAGVLIRRVVPAMAITLAAFAAVQTAWVTGIRQHLIAPLHTVVQLNANNIYQLKVIDQRVIVYASPGSDQRGAWILSSRLTDQAGHPFDPPAPDVCPINFAGCRAWVANQHLQQVLTYEPASRYWALQRYETGIFIAVAVALAVFCAGWVRRRAMTT